MYAALPISCKVYISLIQFLRLITFKSTPLNVGKVKDNFTQTGGVSEMKRLGNTVKKKSILSQMIKFHN